MTRVAYAFAACLFVICGATGAADTPSSKTLIPAAVIQKDFQALYAGLKSAHANLYAQRSREDYDRKYAAMLERFTEPMSPFDVQLEFQRFTAFGKVAHARIEFPEASFTRFKDKGGRTFPIYPRIVDGVAYIGENFSGSTGVAAGDEIVSINGIAMAQWLELTAQMISADTPYIAHSLLEFKFPLYLWAIIGEVAEFELVLRRSGETITRMIPATTREAQRAAADALPETFALDAYSRSFRMIDSAVAYLRPGPFYNVENPEQLWDTEGFIAFIDRAFHHFIEANATSLIIDLRQNPGGDNSFSDPMLAWIADKPFRFYSEFLIRSSNEAAAANRARLEARDADVDSVSARFAQKYDSVPRGQIFPFELPFAQPRSGQRFVGEVYVVVNRHSYSNAVNVAAIVQDYEFGIVVGEKTADMATTYGSMETFKLPNTGIEVGFPKSHIIRPSGNRVPDGVTPQWAIRSPIVANQEDAVLVELLQRIRARYSQISSTYPSRVPTQTNPNASASWRLEARIS
jgi:C-terminal processing protease CtpA/Prc